MNDALYGRILGAIVLSLIASPVCMFVIFVFAPEDFSLLSFFLAMGVPIALITSFIVRLRGKVRWIFILAWAVAWPLVVWISF